MEPILQFDNVTKNYPNGVHALQGVRLHRAARGSSSRSSGRLGRAKSTLLRAINALIPHQAASTVTLDGQIVAAQHGRACGSCVARRA